MRIRRLSPGIQLTLLVLVHAVLVALCPAQEEKAFQIEKVSLGDSLKLVAQQGDVEILISTEVSEGIYANAISGVYTVAQALEQVLQDTPFVAVPVNGGKAFGIINKPNSPHRDPTENSGRSNTNLNKNPQMEYSKPRGRASLSTLFGSLVAFAFTSSPELYGQDLSNDVVDLSPFEVNATGENSLWSVNQTSGGTRVAVPVRELPFSLDVLTTEYMDDFIVSDLSEVLTQIGNVSGLESYTGAGSGNAIRGFSQYYQLRNGFYRNGVVGKTMISRVEVVKGPYAAIYGRGEPGGVINYISKRPVIGENSGKLSLELGEFATQRVQLEHNLALSNQTALLLAGSYYEREFDQQFTHELSRNYGAVLRHRFTPKTEVLVEYEHMFRRNNRGRPATDMRVLGTDPSDGSRNKYLGEFATDFMEQYGWLNTLGPDMYSDRQLDTVNVTFTHQFAPNVNFRAASNDSDTTQHYDYNALGSSTISVDPVTREFVRWNSVLAPRFRQLHADVSNFQADLTVDWDTEAVKHTTLLTFDYTNQIFERVGESAARGRASDVHTVDYGAGPVPNFANDSGALHGPRTNPIPTYDRTINFANNPEYYTRLTENRTLDYDISGLFVMHRARFFQDKLLVMAGGRYDEATTEIIDRRSPDKVTEVGRTKSKVDDLTYNVGLNYNVTPQTVLYGSHSTSFNPKGDVFSHNGAPMPNERGHGYEFGFRTQAFDQRLDIGGSVFSIERQNIRIRNADFDSDFDSPADKPEFVSGGLDRAEGYELYANGKLSDNWSVRLSAGTVDAKHIKSIDDWREGLRLRRVPKWNYALGTSYRVASGALKGLRLNASYRAQSDHRLQDRRPRATDLRNNLRSEEGGSPNLAVAYGWRSSDRLKHTFRVAMKNALDDVFIEGSGYFSLSRRVTASYTLEY